MTENESIEDLEKAALGQLIQGRTRDEINTLQRIFCLNPTSKVFKHTGRRLLRLLAESGASETERIEVLKDTLCAALARRANERWNLCFGFCLEACDRRAILKQIRRQVEAQKDEGTATAPQPVRSTSQLREALTKAKTTRACLGIAREWLIRSSRRRSGDVVQCAKAAVMKTHTDEDLVECAGFFAKVTGLKSALLDIRDEYPESKEWGVQELLDSLPSDPHMDALVKRFIETLGDDGNP